MGRRAGGTPAVGLELHCWLSRSVASRGEQDRDCEKKVEIERGRTKKKPRSLHCSNKNHHWSERSSTNRLFHQTQRGHRKVRLKSLNYNFLLVMQFTHPCNDWVTVPMTSSQIVK